MSPHLQMIHRDPNKQLQRGRAHPAKTGPTQTPNTTTVSMSVKKKKYSTHCQVEQSCALPSFQSLNHKPQEEKKRHQQIRTGQLTFALLEGYPPHQPLYQTRSGTQLLRWGSKQTHVLARRKVEKREKKTGKMERYGNNGVWQIRLNHN